MQERNVYAMSRLTKWIAAAGVAGVLMACVSVLPARADDDDHHDRGRRYEHSRVYRHGDRDDWGGRDNYRYRSYDYNYGYTNPFDYGYSFNFPFGYGYNGYNGYNGWDNGGYYHRDRDRDHRWHRGDDDDDD